MSRWKRATVVKPDKRFVLTPKRRDTLLALERYPSLYTNHLMGVVDPHWGYESADDLFRNLFHFGYLERDVKANIHKIRHTLSEKGEKLLRTHGYATTPAISLHRPRGQAQRIGAYHGQVIMDVVASIEIACKRRGIPFTPLGELVKDHPDPMGFAAEIKDAEHPLQRRRIVPDALVGVGDKSYAIEVEISSPRKPNELRRSSFYKKLLVYRRFINSREYRNQLHADNLRVLVVTTTEKKHQSWMKLLNEQTEQSQLFLFRHFPTFAETFLCPDPYDDVLEHWERVGLPTTNIYE